MLTALRGLIAHGDQFIYKCVCVIVCMSMFMESECMSVLVESERMSVYVL